VSAAHWNSAIPGSRRERTSPGPVGRTSTRSGAVTGRLTARRPSAESDMARPDPIRTGTAPSVARRYVPYAGPPPSPLS